MCPLVSLIRNLLLQLKLLSATMLGQKVHPLQGLPKAMSSARGLGWGLGFHPCRFLLPQIEEEVRRKQFINFSLAPKIRTRWCGASSWCVLPTCTPHPPAHCLTTAPNTRQEGGLAPSRQGFWLAGVYMKGEMLGTEHRSIFFYIPNF